MSDKYDCTADVVKHKGKVEYWLKDFAQQLTDRARIHDDSKLREPEKSIFDAWTPNLRRVQFGGDEYKQALTAMGEGLKHHYENNRHHPEHYPNGLNDMTIVDLIEMFCDWIAAAEEKKSSIDIAYLSVRFGIGPQLAEIFITTLREIDFWNEVNGVPVVSFAPITANAGTIS